MKYHPSWNNDAKEYFEDVIQSHGGWDAWAKLEYFNLNLKKFNGALVYAKGLYRSFFAPNRIIVFPKIRRAEFIYDSHTDVFENGKIIFSPQKKIVETGRNLFKKSTFEQWNPEHAAYFFGYAWTNYLSYPFILPQFELLNYKIEKPASGESVFGIRFPEGFHTHCQNQTFIFNQEKLLQKHNYHAECAGPFVYGAHTTESYIRHKGIQVAQIRKVRPRIGGCSLPVYGIFGEVSFEENEL